MDIPHIQTLRSRLGLGTPHDPESISFGKAISEFRKRYKTPEGLHGASLHNWKDPVQLDALDKMADAFLVGEDRGVEFWPDEGGPTSVKSLRWSTDSHRIKQYMKQLFFRHNQQDKWKGPTSRSFAKSRRSRKVKQKKPPTQALTPSDHSASRETIYHRHQTREATESSDVTMDHPDPYQVPLSPGWSSVETSSQESGVDGILDASPHDSPPRPSRLVETARSEPTAPLAQMTEDLIQRTLETTPPTTSPEIPSGRSRRPVQRQGFVDSATINVDGDLRGNSPGPSERADPNFQPSPSRTNGPYNAQPLQEPESIEQPRPSTESTTASHTVADARKKMPPPPLPKPTTESVTRRSRPKYWIKYSVQKAPGLFKLWDHRGTFNRMTMEEFQAATNLDDVEKVRFTIQGPGMEWDDIVPSGDNFAFGYMKLRFKDKIQDHLEGLKRTGFTRELVSYDLLILPMRREEPGSGFDREQTVCL
ncbi:hypothetical protein F66182_5491 [Fusarium sp. NRRL 66182]|nr:hypothetical protein F66182_5491 [Fusarium sp. NRRL 66182]